MSNHSTFWGNIIDTRRSAFGNLSAIARASEAALEACRRCDKPVTDEGGLFTDFYRSVYKMHHAALEREGRARARTRFSPRRVTPRLQARRSAPRAVRSASKSGGDGGGEDGDGADGEPPRPVAHPSAPDRARYSHFSLELNRIFPSRRSPARSWCLGRGCAA